MPEQGPGPVPKSPEELQAQAATFAAERLPHYEDADFVFRNLSTLATTGSTDVSRMTERNEYLVNDGQQVTKVEPGTERQVATSQEYADYLREVGGSKYEPIARRAELLGAYKDFEPLVQTLREELKSYANREEHPNYLGAGGNAEAFLITLNSHEYVVRMTRGEKPDAPAIDHHLRGGIRAKGIPHLEQIIASSYEQGVTISERMPGHEMGKIKAEELQHVTDEQLGGLIDTIIAANQADVDIDLRPSNFFYDREQGFGVIDVGSSAQQKASEVVSWFGTVIGDAGTYGLRTETLEDYQYLKTQAAVQLPLLERFKAICAQRFAGEDLSKIVDRMDKQIEETKQSIRHYADPEWVSSKIEVTRQRKEEWAKTAAKRTADKASGKNVDTNALDLDAI